ncbi:MAG: biotin/lipoyl-binding protein [Gammaproteobacteria bacterium]|nr:biotin/lipoyl-binding protein [Gammaproteobacteria bacterium]
MFCFDALADNIEQAADYNIKQPDDYNIEQPPAYNIVIQVKSRDIGPAVAIGGTVTPVRTATLTAQLPGRVVRIDGREGSRFRAGNLLLALDDKNLRAKRRAAVAQWYNANAAVRNAGVQHYRQRVSPGQASNAPGGMGVPGMFDQVVTNPISSFMGTRQPGAERYAQVYASGTQVEQARHQLVQAMSQIQQIDTKIRDAMSIAPFNGVIIKKHVEIGDTVRPGQPLLDFADLSSLQIVTDLPARLRKPLIEDVTEVPAEIDGIKELVYVRAATIFPVADPLHHTIRVKFDIPPLAKENRPAPGIYAEVRLPDPHAPRKMHLTVPKTAIDWRGGLSKVFVVSEDQHTALRMIRVGETLPSNEVVVLSGLKDNERILDKPAPGMTSDQIVR